MQVNRATAKYRLDDVLRQINNTTTLMNIKPFVEHRYEQRGAEYTLRSWDKKEMTVTAAMVERPDWLERIIEIAIVGGYVQSIPIPPPDVIVWFRTDPRDNTLIEFVDFERRIQTDGVLFSRSNTYDRELTQ
jgi:hypothetical protein